jgi:hypothetical protein
LAFAQQGVVVHLAGSRQQGGDVIGPVQVRALGLGRR